MSNDHSEMLEVYERKKRVTTKKQIREPKILLIFASWHSALSGVRMLCVGESFACMSC